MPVEIRELRIKTDVVSQQTNSIGKLSVSDIAVLKKQIVAECKRTLRVKKSTGSFNR